MPRYFLINKPYDMLSQFTREVPEHRVLGDLYDFPNDVYPVGRLDRDSEGLLLLTDDKRLNEALLHPSQQHPRSYWVQVEGVPTEQALSDLRKGVDIRVKRKTHHCAPVIPRLLSEAECLSIQERNPPVRFRKSIPDTWIELQLTEGKNRQVRRMCAAVGFPVLRLLRVAIEALQLSDIEEGSVREVGRDWLLPKIGL
ncbi:MAG: 23S rRNA pseudouridine2457 synthase [Neolewinella sp.]